MVKKVPLRFLQPADNKDGNFYLEIERYQKYLYRRCAYNNTGRRARNEGQHQHRTEYCIESVYRT